MQEQLIETYEKEGLPAVRFFDASKKLAGDRWQVNLVVRMQVDVDESISGLPAPVDEIRRRIGDTVTFEHKTSRTFVAQIDKDDLLSEMCEEFKNTALPYLYHEDFQKNLITNRYRDLLTKDYIKTDG